MTDEIEEMPKWVISNSKLYDTLKSIAQVILPGLGTLYAALSAIWGLPASEQVVATIVALDAFLGVILSISSAKYNSSDAKYSGDIVVTPDDDGIHNITKLALNPDVDLAANQELLFKVTPPDEPHPDL